MWVGIGGVGVNGAGQDGVELGWMTLRRQSMKKQRFAAGTPMALRTQDVGCRIWNPGCRHDLESRISLFQSVVQDHCKVARVPGCHCRAALL